MGKPTGFVALQINELTAGEVARAKAEKRETDFTRVCATAGVSFTGTVNLSTNEFNDDEDIPTAEKTTAVADTISEFTL